MRTTDRHARNDRIVYLRLQGWTITKIAAECGMSERHCARILEERKQTGWSGPGSPVVDGADLSSASASELLDALEARVGDLARMAREQPAQQQSLGRALRLEVTVKMAERKIAELRRRTDQLAPADPVPEQGSPPSEPDMS
jgi:hypothetical protein